MRLCPACSQVVMLTFRHQQLEIDSCPECFGLWFDREELKAFLQQPEFYRRFQDGPGPTAEKPAEAEGLRLCPNCRKPLRQSSLGEVVVDCCSHCHGIWLDQGELPGAVEQYRQGRRGNLLVLNQIAEGLRAARKESEE